MPQGIILRFPYNRKMVMEVKDLDGEFQGKESNLWSVPLTMPAVEYLIAQNFDLEEDSLSNIETFIAERLEVDQFAEQRRAWSQAYYAHPIPEVEALLDPKILIPAPFQWVPCYFARLTDAKFMLSDPMGAGKTIEAVLVTLLPEYRDLPVLIICPANAVYNWQSELMAKFGFRSQVVTKPLPYLTPGIRFYIVSFNMSDRVQFADSAFLIVDESAEIKNREAQRTKRVEARAALCPHKMLMSGTPTPNRPEEAYSQIKIIDPHFMPYDEFTKLYCNQKKSRHSKYRKDVSGSSNLKELHELLFTTYLVRREKHVIMPQLPNKTRQVFHLANKKVEGESLMEMYANNALLKSVDPDFIDWLKAVLDSTEGEKHLWFFHHQTMGKALKDLCKELDIEFCYIDGSTPKEFRQKQVELFQSDEKHRIFILSIMAAATALTLTKATVNIQCEVVFSPEIHHQAEDRIHRMGQTKDCFIFYPLLTKLENRIWDIQTEKRVIIEQIYKGTDLDPDGSSYSLKAKIAEEFGVPVIKRREKVNLLQG